MKPRARTIAGLIQLVRLRRLWSTLGGYLKHMRNRGRQPGASSHRGQAVSLASGDGQIDDGEQMRQLTEQMGGMQQAHEQVAAELSSARQRKTEAAVELQAVWQREAEARAAIANETQLRQVVEAASRAGMPGIDTKLIGKLHEYDGETISGLSGPRSSEATRVPQWRISTSS